MNTDTVSQSRKLEVQLMVDHPHLRVQELESVLMLAADVRWDVNDVVPKSPQRRYQFSRWALVVEVDSLDELPAAIRALKQRIAQIEGNFGKLPAGSKVGLTLFVTESDTVIGFGFDPSVIDLLARIHGSLEISLVIREAGRD